MKIQQMQQYADIYSLQNYFSYSSFAVNKYLHTVASVGFLFTLNYYYCYDHHHHYHHHHHHYRKLCPHCINVFCIYLKTKRDLCHLHHKPILFITEMKCLLRGTDFVFK